MSEEKITQIDEKCCLDDAKTNEINVRRYSTGALDKGGGQVKAQVQTRYRGNQLSSTHDLCKHGKRRDEELVIKPWKLVKKKDVSKQEKPPLQVVKKDVVSEIVKSFDVKRSEIKSTNSAVVRKVKKIDLEVNKASRISENKNSKEDVMKNLKNKEKMKMDLDVKKVSRMSENKSSREDVLKNLKKTDLDVKKVSRISENKSCKESVLKNLKNKEKIDEYGVEKTLYVVESSIEKEKEKEKSIKSEIQQSSEKKILSGKKSLSLLPSLSPSPRPIRQTTSRSQIGLSEKKENGSTNLVANSKTESKIMPKRIGLRATPSPPTSMQVSFKKGKVLEQKPEDSTLTLIKFKKRIVQEPKLITDEIKKMKNVKVEGEDVEDMNDEGKGEKVVLRHREVEEKKKLQRLYNNVIEETVNKLEEVKKSKVKALVGAFETVISLQENDKASHKKMIQRKYTSSRLVEG